MSGQGFPQRLGVFLATAAACLAGLAAVGLGPTGARAPVPDDLRDLETAMRSGARLHAPAPASEPTGSAPFCRECHPLPPHPGRSVAAAIENDHGQRMDCLLCHWPAVAGPRPAPSWQVQAGAGARLAVLPPERSSREELGRLRSAATVGRPCFERGPACGDCHRPGGLGWLVRPGSPPGRAASLERLETFFTLPPGQKWYFPELR